MAVAPAPLALPVGECEVLAHPLGVALRLPLRGVSLLHALAVAAALPLYVLLAVVESQAVTVDVGLVLGLAPMLGVSVALVLCVAVGHCEVVALWLPLLQALEVDVAHTLEEAHKLA